jgi:hypothetical protein
LTPGDALSQLRRIVLQKAKRCVHDVFVMREHNAPLWWKMAGARVNGASVGPKHGAARYELLESLEVEIDVSTKR